MGQFFAYLAPTAAVATVLGAVNHFMWNIFNGFLVPQPLMARGWRWLNSISATTWVIYSLAASQLGNNDHPMVLEGFARALLLPAMPLFSLKTTQTTVVNIRKFSFCAGTNGVP